LNSLDLRAAIAGAAEQNLNFLTPDEGSDRYYDDVIEIDLTTLEPQINGPYTPDLAHPMSKFGDAVNKNGLPKRLSASLVGSCTNSSYEELMKVPNLLTQAKSAGLKPKVPFFVSTGSEQIRATAEDAGFLNVMKDAGATILSSSCGPCVGQWNRLDIPKDERSSIISSFNRNFTGYVNISKLQNITHSNVIVAMMVIKARIPSSHRPKLPLPLPFGLPRFQSCYRLNCLA
jgi:aconitate hydratase